MTVMRALCVSLLAALLPCAAPGAARSELLPGASTVTSVAVLDIIDLNRALAEAPQGETPRYHQTASATDSVSRDDDGDALSATLASLVSEGLAPTNVRPGDRITERALSALVSHVARHCHGAGYATVAVMDPDAPASRIRVLTSLVRLLVTREEIVTYRRSRAADLLSDADDIPGWGRPFAAAAVDQGWWGQDSALRPRSAATWAFAVALLCVMPVHRHGAGRYVELEVVDEGPFTGLVVDARDMPIQRTMGPRIVSESGEVLYPDPTHTLSPDELQDRGMASYDPDPGSAQRAGNHPLVVRAIDLTGFGRDDVVVSSSDAERIRSANRRTHFLDTFSVSICVNGKS